MSESTQPPARPSAPASAAGQPAKPVAFARKPAPAKPSRRAAADAPPPETKPIHWLLLGVIVILAIGLRAKEPMSSGIIGAEDPYRHMERTWDLAQGKGFSEYPPGINLILLPFTFLGPDAFYVVSQYIPLAFGASLVVGLFLLGRAFLHPAGALVGSGLAAVMPEMIRRTDLLFPTALDLALLPFLFLAILRVAQGSRRALWPAGLLAAFIFLSHPWVIALMVPPLAVFALYVAVRQGKSVRGPLLGIFGGLAAMALVSMLIWPLHDLVLQHAMPALGGLFSGNYTPPVYVDLPAMLTLPALLMAAVGAYFAVRRRDPYSILALSWTLLVLPFVLVTWFGPDMWYLPHRTVVYFGLGVAMLAAIPVSELLQVMKESRPQAQPSATFGAVALALLVTTPSGLNLEPWYRIFDDADLQAWEELDEQGTSWVVAGSWETRAGYRATTARDAVYYPEFFSDPLIREMHMREHPGLVVLIDCRTADHNPTDFLSDWRLVGEWGDRRCEGKMGWQAAYTK